MTSYYRGLIVWQKSVDLAECVYRVTKDFPKEETYGLVDQMKRSSVSISSNISEGAGRGSNQDYVRFLYIARWSCCELETQILLSERLWFLVKSERNNLEERIEEILKMLSTLIKNSTSSKTPS